MAIKGCQQNIQNWKGDRSAAFQNKRKWGYRFPHLALVILRLKCVIARCTALWWNSTQIWAYSRMLVFTIGICVNVRTVRPASSPGNNPRQPVPLVINAVGTISWAESATIAFLPRATAATTMTTSTAPAWPADNHYGTKP